MSLTVNKSVGKCSIHLVPRSADVGGLCVLVSPCLTSVHGWDLQLNPACPAGVPGTGGRQLCPLVGHIQALGSKSVVLGGFRRLTSDAARLSEPRKMSLSLQSLPVLLESQNSREILFFTVFLTQGL